MKLDFIKLPEIATERLILKQITTNEVDDVFEIRSNPITMEFIPRPKAKTKADALAVIELINNGIAAKTKINWGIFLKNSPKLIGIIGFVNIYEQNNRAEIGYVLNSKFHRQGIMQEAINATVQFGFNELNFHSMEAIINAKNIASCNLITKAKFTEDAYFKDFIFFNNQYFDAKVFSKVNTQ